MFAGGNIRDILNMFSGHIYASNNPVTGNSSVGLIQNLVEKFGLDERTAGGIAGLLVPDVMQSLVNRTHDPDDDSLDIQGIFNNHSGGTTSGFNVQGLLNKL